MCGIVRIASGVSIQFLMLHVRELFQRSFEAHIDDLDGKNYILSVGNLHSPVKVESCSWKVKTGRLSIFLLHARSRYPVLSICTETLPLGMVIVTLPKTNSSTWADLKTVDSKMAKKPPKMEESEDPGAGIMNLMKQMYDDGDDEMKRTISKAWYESREKNMGMGMGM